MAEVVGDRESVLAALRRAYGQDVEVWKEGKEGGKVLAWPVLSGEYKFVFGGNFPSEEVVAQIDDIIGASVRHRMKMRMLLLTLANTTMTKNNFEDAVIHIVKGATGDSNMYWCDGPRVWGRDQYGRKKIVDVEEGWCEVVGAEGGVLGYIDGKAEVAAVVSMGYKLWMEGWERGGAGGAGGIYGGGGSGVVDMLLGRSARSSDGVEINEILVKVICEQVIAVYPSGAVSVVLQEGDGDFLVYKSAKGEMARVKEG